MPYINQEARKYLDEELAGIIAKIKVLQQKEDNPLIVAGLLNYVCTKIALGIIPERRYWAIALISGVFSNISSEFYRRYAIPYEEEMIEKYGDIYK
jgi:hypothetical protein